MHSQPPADPPAPQPNPPVPTSQPSGLRINPLVGALLVGLLLGGGGVGAVWALSDDDNGSTKEPSGASDARAGCQALAGFKESLWLDQGSAGDVHRNRFAAAGSLTASAAAVDPSYEELAEALRRAQQRHMQVFEFDDETKKDLAKARELCKEL
ncbi:hypothetical protein ACH41E_11415 [Streptomyces sp. NPDC020412]|uniref:hypothetical protein n=1 Tax=Streptomyces sp. NPDC020412 TaxID=3365073 RepID=UPI0037ABCDBC